MSGVKTIADLQDRCWVDELTGCWHWRQGRDGNGKPSLWLPALKRRTSLGVAIGWLVTGQASPRGVVWHCTCETPDCCNPEHRKAGTRSSQMKAAGIKRPPIVKARIAAGKRAQSAISEATVIAIRESNESLRTLSERHGVSISHASLIRRGELRAPLACSQASVFNWRPAA